MEVTPYYGEIIQECSSENSHLLKFLLPDPKCTHMDKANASPPPIHLVGQDDLSSS